MAWRKGKLSLGTDMAAASGHTEWGKEGRSLRLQAGWPGLQPQTCRQWGELCFFRRACLWLPWRWRADW